ncbi:hypothetical protein Trco_003407 [Trichoderma cornu-damae]|uniref:Uncharacterized protein n=1 Tax=Trichoderma cornu-damae TaxID=654480 RepID=A0A9P8QL02_9HYPO|nr:hypothetical protein Trco_003407 [Trichoderma cornu-damae]
MIRRDLSLRVAGLEVEPVLRSGVVARCHNVGGDVVSVVVEEVVDVEEVKFGVIREAGGRVTSQIIVANRTLCRIGGDAERLVAVLVASLVRLVLGLHRRKVVGKAAGGGVGHGVELGGERGRVHGGVGGGPHDLVHQGLLGGGYLLVVLRGEELLGQGDAVLERAQGGGGGAGDDAGASPEAVELLDEHEVGLLGVDQERLELLIALLEGLDLEPLSLSRRLGGASVPENTLNATLFLFIFSLGTLPVKAGAD